MKTVIPQTIASKEEAFKFLYDLWDNDEMIDPVYMVDEEHYFTRNELFKISIIFAFIQRQYKIDILAYWMDCDDTLNETEKEPGWDWTNIKNHPQFPTSRDHLLVTEYSVPSRGLRYLLGREVILKFTGYEIFDELVIMN